MEEEVKEVLKLLAAVLLIGDIVRRGGGGGTLPWPLEISLVECGLMSWVSLSCIMRYCVGNALIES